MCTDSERNLLLHNVNVNGEQFMGSCVTGIYLSMWPEMGLMFLLKSGDHYDQLIFGHIGCDSYLCLLSMLKFMYEMSCLRALILYMHIILSKLKDSVFGSAG